MARPLLDAAYIVPLRWPSGHPPAATCEMACYLGDLAPLVDVIVVDGSDLATRAGHERAWARWAVVVPPEPWPGRNGKVAGVVTGVRLARHERVVLADDDVRYDPRELEEVLAALCHADLVRPQNVFSPSPWHARWDTGRTLLNRAVGADHPGTCGVRRSTFLRMGGYDGDVLFENLELARTVRAAGGRVVDLPGTFVRRLPPTTRHFLGQRLRQAYDDLAQPARLAVELAVLPSSAALLLGGRRRWAAAAAALVVLLAETGRRRCGGAQVWPPTAAAWSLPWLLERSVCVWAAVALRARGGVRYAGGRLLRAATPPRRLAEAVPAQSPLGELYRCATGPVAHR